ncbi:acetoacyl-CoA synthetase [Dacryopinax primogenitus]|uniref:Acetoacyl-CoA synthetase n=1 Tax=Dacryopinax primogenitus (strain DJM 731) TaxID=1858805 RepID=M5G3S0_DACPD|nr:acetoacyl-CoA synthetase [Dacryopinax primogenitus]EJU04891.1 acetoacyl-CoA synthetase [Dacryopinax primogenitus]
MSSAARDRPLLHVPSEPQKTETSLFREHINAKYGLHLEHYGDLYKWSTSPQSYDKFWEEVWEWTGVIGDKGSIGAVDTSLRIDDVPPFFPGSSLNFAENLLRHGQSTKVALVQAVEPTPNNLPPKVRSVTYAELNTLVARLVNNLRGYINPGDRVASYSSNNIENIIACLATTALGGIWVSAAAHFGADGVLERLEQVKPKIVFSVDGTVYNGRCHAHIPKLVSVLSRLSIPPEKVVIIPGLPQSECPPAYEFQHNWISWDKFLAPESAVEGLPIKFFRTAFDWPLWILFSSGTTGRPKPIVHRAGGMLLQLNKELLICGDFKASDVFFYYTTTGWMMWNYLIAGLTAGCSLVLYDCSPLKDPSILWRLAEQCKITVFGTRSVLPKVYEPRGQHDLSSIRMIMSTGSPLAASQYDYVYNHIQPNSVLASISGGTDICSLFVGQNTSLPVYRGEVQTRMLGMGVTVHPTPVSTSNEKDIEGELICTLPFVAQPLGFWPLPGFGSDEEVKAAKKRYMEAYYQEVPGAWYQGDHIIVTASRMHNAGGVIMLGRSDGVLNPGGVRFGSAEIYSAISILDESPVGVAISDALVVGLKVRGGADEKVVLFLKMNTNWRSSPSWEEIVQAVKKVIRERRSPRHVPDWIIQVNDIPYTLNGKLVEVTVKKVINGAPLSTINASTLRNPQCLPEYVEHGNKLRLEAGVDNSYKL